MSAVDDIKLSKWTVAWHFIRDAIADPWRMILFCRLANAMPAPSEVPSFGTRTRMGREHLGMTIARAGEILDMSAEELVRVEAGEFD